MDLSEYDNEIAILTINFKKFLSRKNFSIQMDNKKNEVRKNKEVIWYKCEKLGPIRNECPKLKFKSKGVKNKKKAFKAIWDDSSDLKKEEDQ